MLAETVPFWTVDSGATDHIARDRNAYVDFRRIPKGSRNIFMGNNTSADVLGIGTCKLMMWNCLILYLHDVLYALEVRQNLVLVIMLVKLGFTIIFEPDCVKVSLDKVVYAFEYMLEGLLY